LVDSIARITRAHPTGSMNHITASFYAAPDPQSTRCAAGYTVTPPPFIQNCPGVHDPRPVRDLQKIPEKNYECGSLYYKSHFAIDQGRLEQMQEPPLYRLQVLRCGVGLHY